MASAVQQVRTFFHGILGTPKEEKKEEAADLGKPVSANKLIVQRMSGGSEAMYFWILNFMRHPNSLGYEIVEKISDVFSASESSSFFGNIEQRKAVQQDRISQFLATIGSMTKSLFQMIRELRIIDERLDYYEKSLHAESKEGEEAAEIALKGIWVDLVEGGAENAASVYGLQRKVGFVILPDLFFKVHVRKTEELDKAVDALKEEGINRKVREVLKRKLFQYYAWKDRTWKELKWRRKFTLRSLHQHYQSMKLYTKWIKPYLRHIERMEMANLAGPELVTAFETSHIKLELVGTKKEFEILGEHRGGIVREFKETIPVMRVRFEIVALPEMAFQKEYAHRGALHMGRMEITIEGFVVKREAFEKYKAKRSEEDFELIKAVDRTLEALGDELQRYLKEAEGEAEKEAEEKKKKESMLKGISEPFTSILAGFKELFGAFKVERREKREKLSYWEATQEEEAAKALLKHNVYLVYDIFKKNYGMLSP